MPLIVVCGPIANKPGNGGAAWTRLSWVLGLRRLDCDVYFVEQIAPESCVDMYGVRCELGSSRNLSYFRQVTEAFEFGTRSALVLEDGSECAGLNWSELSDLADAADLLVNLSGHLTLDTLKPKFRKRVFVDNDPGYTQLWYAAGLAEERLRNHHFYFTVGENIGKPHCSIPVMGIEWRPLPQPVVLDEWPVVNDVGDVAAVRRFTTVGSWRGPYGRLTHEGGTFGLKAHEFRKFLALPTCSSLQFEIALDIHPADEADVESLIAHGWRIADPNSVAANPQVFRRYVQQSSAEFSVAQGIYVDTCSGWFSDRTVRYLASGKPTLVQDTGFGRTYPVGCGLLSFRTLADAVQGAERINRDYTAHSRAARAIAERFFDSDKVISTLLETAKVA